MVSVRLAHVVVHYLQFENLGGFSKNICATFQLIWLTCMWVIWPERNARFFRRADPRYMVGVRRRPKVHSCRGSIFILFYFIKGAYIGILDLKGAYIAIKAMRAQTVTRLQPINRCTFFYSPTTFHFHTPNPTLSFSSPPIFH